MPALPGSWVQASGGWGGPEGILGVSGARAPRRAHFFVQSSRIPAKLRWPQLTVTSSAPLTTCSTRTGSQQPARGSMLPRPGRPARPPPGQPARDAAGRLTSQSPARPATARGPGRGGRAGHPPAPLPGTPRPQARGDRAASGARREDAPRSSRDGAEFAPGLRHAGRGRPRGGPGSRARGPPRSRLRGPSPTRAPPLLAPRPCPGTPVAAPRTSASRSGAQRPLGYCGEEVWAERAGSRPGPAEETRGARGSGGRAAVAQSLPRRARGPWRRPRAGRPPPELRAGVRRALSCPARSGWPAAGLGAGWDPVRKSHREPDSRVAGKVGSVRRPRGRRGGSATRPVHNGKEPSPSASGAPRRPQPAGRGTVGGGGAA